MLTATANQSPFVQADLDQPVPEYPQSGFLLALKIMEAVSGDNWSYKTCKAPVKSSPGQQTITQLSAGLSLSQQCQSSEKKKLDNQCPDIKQVSA